MEIRRWVRQMFRKSYEVDGTVPFFDAKSGRVLRIAPSEMPANAFLVRVPDADWLAWASPDQLGKARAGSDLTLIHEKRAVLLCGSIFDELATMVVAQLLFLNFENRDEPIHLVINSVGGSVTAALSIRDTMDRINQPVHTCCLQEALGMAGILLAHGTKGHRSAFGRACFSFGHVTGRSETPAARHNLGRTVQVLTEMLATDTGRPEDTILADMQNERRFDADGALAYGLIDEILV